MSDGKRKWKVTLEINEDTVREYHDQTESDYPTQPSDVKDLFADVLGDAGRAYGMDIRGGVEFKDFTPFEEV